MTYLQVVQAQHSASGDTTKLLLELQDGLTVESVIMHYDTSGASHNMSASWSRAAPSSSVAAYPLAVRRRNLRGEA